MILCGLYCPVLQGVCTEPPFKWNFTLTNQVITGRSPFPCRPPFIDPDSFPFLNTQVEPAIAIGRNPINPSKPMVAVVYQEDRYISLGGASDDYMIISLNGGKTFGKPIPGPTVLCFDGPFERATDPHVAITDKGDIYFTTLGLSVLNSDLWGVSVSKYNVRQKKFIYTRYFDVVDAGSPPFSSPDFDGIFLDPQDPSGNLAYMTWDLITFPDNGDFSTSLFRLTKTVDGINWSTPISIDPFPPSSLVQFGEDVGPQFIGLDFLNNPGKSYSKLLATFALTVNADFNVPPYNQSSFSYSMTSDDQGKTWTNPIPVNNTVDDVQGQAVDPDNFTIPNVDNAPIRISGGGTIVDRERNIIYLITQEHSLVYDGIPTQIILYYSLDDAASWNLIGPINTVLSTQAFGPANCLIDEGRIAVSYYDFRNYHGKNTAAPLLTDRWMDIYYFDKVTKTLTLENETRLTNKSFNLRNAPAVVGSAITPPGLFLGDYFGQTFFERQIFNVYGIVPAGEGPNSSHLQLSILTAKRPIPGNQ